MTRTHLSVKEVEQRIGIAKSTLDKKRLDGGGPPYVKLGKRVIYPIVELEKWLAENQRTATSGDAPTSTPDQSGQ